MRPAYLGAGYKWVPRANYHVTVRFFGELNADQVDRAATLIESVALATLPFDGRASAAKPLPNRRKPSVIVLPIESSGRLESLAADCARVLNADFGPADKPFKAHLTVIRCGRGARFKETAALVDVSLSFAHIALFESTSGNGAPTYTPLREFQLGAHSDSVDSQNAPS
jgi:2'-5' RNA ligase